MSFPILNVQKKMRQAFPLLFTIFFYLCSQAQPIQFNKVTPVSPDAAALGKFGEFPVSLQTGTISIDIPIYTVKGRKLSIPVSLSYHGSGIRVDEMASSVGLGWALSAGASISRSVRGIADDNSQGFITAGSDCKTNDEMWALPWQTRASNFERIENSLLDCQSDRYFYNIGGVAGEFSFDMHREAGNEMVTSYTHHRLFGLTSKTDVNGRTTYFEYDALGRLTLVKDHENNILKQYDYKYQQPVTP